MFFPLNRQEAETRFVPSVQDFDKKLAEADAYLQILIDQLKVGQSFLFFFSFNTSPFAAVPETYGKVCHLRERGRARGEAGCKRLIINLATLPYEQRVQSTDGKHGGRPIMGKTVASVTTREINTGLSVTLPPCPWIALTQTLWPLAGRCLSSDATVRSLSCSQTGTRSDFLSYMACL